MKYIKYKTKTVYTLENGEEITEYNECMCIYTPKNEEIAKREAYNGEYTIEDDGKPEPVIPPTNAELAAENKLLKQQVSALTDQQSFYEDCIAEMAEVVYA